MFREKSFQITRSLGIPCSVNQFEDIIFSFYRPQFFHKRMLDEIYVRLIVSKYKERFCWTSEWTAGHNVHPVKAEQLFKTQLLMSGNIILQELIKRCFTNLFGAFKNQVTDQTCKNKIVFHSSKCFLFKFVNDLPLQSEIDVSRTLPSNLNQPFFLVFSFFNSKNIVANLFTNFFNLLVDLFKKLIVFFENRFLVKYSSGYAGIT